MSNPLFLQIFISSLRRDTTLLLERREQVSIRYNLSFMVIDPFSLHFIGVQYIHDEIHSVLHNIDNTRDIRCICDKLLETASHQLYSIIDKTELYKLINDLYQRGYCLYELQREININNCIEKQIKQIERLIVNYYISTDEITTDVCSICLDHHTTVKTIKTECNHIFGRDCFTRHHADCISKQTPLFCPCCRKKDPTYCGYRLLTQT